MRCRISTALFFVLFALFSSYVSLPNYMPNGLSDFFVLFAAMAYAAPVASEGAIVKRQGCMGLIFREAVSVGGMSPSLKRVVA